MAESSRGQRDVVDARQFGEVGRLERTQPDRGPAGRRQLSHAVRERPRVVLADDEQGQDTIGGQPAQGEEQRAQRSGVGPLRVIDDDHHGLRGLQGTEVVEQMKSGVDLARLTAEHVPQQPGRAQQLVQQREFDVRFGLQRLSGDDVRVAESLEQAVHERRLADSRLAFHQHDPRRPGSRIAIGLAKLRQFDTATHELGVG